MTQSERKVSSLISKAYLEFGKLKQQHPDDIRDFVNGVHIMQGLLMQRAARRADKAFPIYEAQST